MQQKIIFFSTDCAIAGKISVRRKEQSIVRKALYKIQNEMLELIMVTMRAEDRAKQAEEEARRCKEELKHMKERMRDQGEKGKIERRNENRVSGRQKAAQRREVESEESDSRSWLETRVRKRRPRTYAEVSAGVNGEKIEGRVIIPGEEGRKTPPPKPRRERALIVSSREEKDASTFANSLAKNVSPRDIGGAPRAVRKVNDGKVVLVPRDDVQKGKLVEALMKVKGVEVRESRPAEPLLVVTGVAKGLTYDELTAKIRRGLGDGVSERKVDIKAIKRLVCRNVWKENIVIKTEIDLFKELVKKGKIDIDCTLCFVKEYLGVAMCFRCCRFGHLAKVCREAET